MRTLPGRPDEQYKKVAEVASQGSQFGALKARSFTGGRYVTGGGQTLVHRDEPQSVQSSNTTQCQREAENRPWRHLTVQEQHAAIARGVTEAQERQMKPAPVSRGRTGIDYVLPKPGSWKNRGEGAPMEAWTIRAASEEPSVAVSNQVEGSVKDEQVEEVCSAMYYNMHR